MLTDYRIEKLDAARIKDLQYIYKDAFGKGVSLDYLQHKQNTAFAGLGFVGFLAYAADDEPAAFYGVFPCFVTHGEKKYLVAQSGDTMTHSRHTGKGLFTALAQKTYGFCRENGIHLVFGFPNQNSYPGFVKKLGWSHFDNMEAYVIRVKCLSWVRLKKMFGLPQKWHTAFCRKTLSRLPKGTPFANSCQTPTTPAVLHDDAFFAYKTYEQNYLVRINNVNVWLKTSDVFLLVGDMQVCDEPTFLHTLNSLRSLAFRMGLPHLRFQCSPGTWLHRMLHTRARRLEVLYPVGGIGFSGEIPLENLKFTMADNDGF